MVARSALWLVIVATILAFVSQHANAAEWDIEICLPLTANQFGLDGQGCFPKSPTNLPVPGDPIVAAMNCVVSQLQGKKCVNAPTNPSTPLPTPGGWSGPNSPPSTTAQIQQYRFQGDAPATNYNTSAEACNMTECAQNVDPNVTSITLIGNPVSSCQCNMPSYSSSRAINEVTSCPAGYTVSGGSCTLTNASLVQKPSDGRCDIKQTGNSYAFDSQDPDCGSGSVTTAVTGSTVTSTQAKQVTSRSTATTTINGDGTITIVKTTANDNGTTTTITVGVSAPGGGGATTIIGATSATTQGTGNQNTGQPAPSGIDLPTDYNRESTQQAIQGKLDEIATKLEPGDSTVTTPGLGTIYEKKTRTFQDALTDFRDEVGANAFITAANGFFNISVPSSGCPVWSVSTWVFDVNIDAQCAPVMDTIFPAIAAVLLATAGFVAFRWAFL